MGENVTEKKYSVLSILLFICILFPLFGLLNIFTVIVAWLLVILLLSFLLLAVAGVGELVVGIAMVGIGIEKIFSMPMGAVAVMGFGICNIGVALLLEYVVFWLYGVAVPMLFKKIFRREVSHEEEA